MEEYLKQINTEIDKISKIAESFEIIGNEKIAEKIYTSLNNLDHIISEMKLDCKAMKETKLLT